MLVCERACTYARGTRIQTSRASEILKLETKKRGPKSIEKVHATNYRDGCAISITLPC